MKKFNVLAKVVGAMSLGALVGLVGCSKKDDPGDEPAPPAEEGGDPAAATEEGGSCSGDGGTEEGASCGGD